MANCHPIVIFACYIKISAYSAERRLCVYYSDKRPSDKWAGGRADGDGRNIILGRHICIYNWRNQGANEQLSLARAAASGLVSVWLAPLRRQTNRYSERGQGAGSRAAAERHDERRTRAPWGLGPVVPPPPWIIVLADLVGIYCPASGDQCLMGFRSPGPLANP